VEREEQCREEGEGVWEEGEEECLDESAEGEEGA